MINLFLFSFLLSISLIINEKVLFGLCFVIISILFFKKIKLNKKIIFILLGIALIFVIFYLIRRFLNININYYFVLERKENYCLVTNLFKKYYVNISEKYNFIDEFDVLYIEGNLEKLNFKTYESSFDFEHYLNSKFVFENLEINKLDIILDFPINNYLNKNNFLTSIENDEVSFVINSLLFCNVDYDSEIIKNLKNLGLASLISSSGLLTNFIIFKISGLLEYFLDKRKAKNIAFFIFLPLMIINISKFAIKKIIFMNLFYMYKEKTTKNFEKAEILSIFGIFSLFINPNISFNISFALTLSVSFLFIFLNNILKKSPNLVKKLKVNIILVFYLIPITLIFNKEINLLSFLYSLILLPLSKILYIFGIIIFLIGPLDFLIKIYSYLIKPFNALDFNLLIFYGPEFSEFITIIFYLLFFLIIYYSETKTKKIRNLFIVGDIFISLINFLPIQNYLYFSVSFINVGQGDSTLITYRNKNYLIDTGGLTYKDVANDILIPYFKTKRIYKIDYVYITHFDFDHYGALDDLCANFKVDKIFNYNNISENDVYFINNLNVYNELWNDENSKSLVLNINVNNLSFLLMGDAPKEIEERIIQDYKNLKVDYLKVGHHGSKTSSSYEFLETIMPKEAIISCGVDNRYGHPSEETIYNLEKLNIKIRRTDLEGTIEYKFFIL